MIDFRLDTFLDLCKTKNFTQTASNLHITQPAVSQHIKFLEKYYETKLFHHEGRQLYLTEHGKLLQEFALTAKADSLAIRSRLQSKMSESEDIKLGSVPTIGEVLMPSIVAEYIKSFPAKKITMYLSETDTLLQQLEDGQINFAIIDNFFMKNAYDSEFLYEDDTICVCSPQHPLAGKTVDFREIYNDRLIFRENKSNSQMQLQTIFQRNNQDITNFNSYIEIGTINAVKKMVSQNIGITFTYRFMVQEDLNKGWLKEIHIRNFSAHHRFNFVWMKNSFFTPGNVQFLDIAKKVIRTISGS